MRTVVQIIGWIALAVCMINYGVDFCLFLKDRYCRFHIGRWNRENWNIAIEKIALRWLRRTPTVKVTDNSRYILLDIVNGKYKSNTIQSWQKAALILGLCKSKDEGTVQLVKAGLATFFDDSGMWKSKPIAVDCGMLSYAILTNIDDSYKIKPAMDYSLKVIVDNVNEYGMVSYTGGKNNPDMYVDTIGLVAPFLVTYAKYYNCPEYEELGFKQLELFHEYGLLKGTNLPNHAFNIRSKLPLGVFGWGRGIGWYVIGLMDSYEMFQKQEYKECVKQWIREAADEYMKYQRPDGGFGSIVQSTNTYDSSATAVMAWFFMECARIFDNKDYNQTAEHCMNKLMKCTRITGAIDWCQGDTKGIGIFAQTYDIMPFAQGMTLRAIV